MRNLSSTLARRLRRPDCSARVLIEADVVARGVIVNTPDEWNDCDSATGLDVRSDGTLRLAGTQQTFASSLSESTVGATFVTDLNRVSPHWVVLASLSGADPNRGINRVIAHLDPDPLGTGRNVDQWRCQMFAVYEVLQGLDNGPPGGPGISGDVLVLGDSSPVVSVVEAGTADHEVTFAFPQPLTVPARPQAAGSAYPNPTVIVMIWAVTNAGIAAANVEWQTTAQAVVDGLYGVELEEPAYGDDSRKGQYGILAGGQHVPLVAIGYLSYANDDATFTTNPLDAGADPSANSDVRLIGRARVPPGTAVRFYVRNDADSGWVLYTDGQRASDLANVDFTATAGTSRKFRVELDTNAAGDVTPEVLAMGFEHVTTTALYDIAEVESCEWIVEPVTLKARLPEVRIRGLRDGVQDFNAAIDRLLSENDSADLSFAVYVGHPDDDRATWMLIDRFPIVDDWDSDGHSHVVIAVSPLAFLRGGPTGERRLPRYDVATGEREDLIYDGTATKNAPSEIWEDLILTQLGISPFWVGAPPDDVTLTYLDETGASQTLNLATTTGLKKRISDSDAHDEVDSIGFVPGFATVSSQGAITAVRMRGGEGPIRAIFSADDITWLSVTPGFRYRRPVLFTEYNFWDAPDDPDEVRSFHQNAIDNLGAGRISSHEYLPGSWITAKAIAEAVGAREVQAFGAGIVQWTFTSMWPYPELEIGDRVAVEVDRFAAKDPNVARTLRGALWAVGRIVGVHNVWGTHLTVAIENWADIIAASEVVSRIGLPDLFACQLYLTGDDTYVGNGAIEFAVLWDAALHDLGDQWQFNPNAAAYTAEAVVGIREAGLYEVTWVIDYASYAGAVTVYIIHDDTVGGTDEFTSYAFSTLGLPATGKFVATTTFQAAHGDVIVGWVEVPNASATITLKSGIGRTTFSVFALSRSSAGDPGRQIDLVDPIRRRWPFR